MVKLNTADLKNKSSILFQMPLEYIMVVKHPNKYVSDRLVYADNQKILVAGYGNIIKKMANCKSHLRNSVTYSRFNFGSKDQKRRCRRKQYTVRLAFG